MPKLKHLMLFKDFKIQSIGANSNLYKIVILLHFLACDPIDSCIDNLNKCEDGVYLENDITLSMQKEFLVKGTPLFQLEDNFLNISASDSADSLFCCVVFSIPTDEHGTMKIARYFEFGSFSGFYTNFGHNKIKEMLQLDCLMPYNVYTATDMEMYATRKKKLFLNTKKGINLH